MQTRAPPATATALLAALQGLHLIQTAEGLSVLILTAGFPKDWSYLVP